MVKKGEIISLAIVVIFGLAISSFITGSGPYEEYFTDTKELGPTEPDVSGSATADIYMAFLDPDGNPVVEQESGLSTLVEAGTTNEVTTWSSELTSLTIEGQGIDRSTVTVKITAYLKWWSYSGSYPEELRKRIGGSYRELFILDDSEFDLEGDSTHFIAKSRFLPQDPDTQRYYAASIQVNLIDSANELGFPYMEDNREWKFEMEVIVEATATNGNPKKTAIQETIPLTTDWGSGDTQNPKLLVSGDFGGAGRSFIPSTTTGLSVTFLIVVIFFGIWYKWVRKLIHGT